jgi:hypothetical protein
MSELAKKIGRAQRREVPGGMGFGAARREQPRAMVLAVVARTADEARDAVAAGADAVVVDAGDAAKAAEMIKGLEKVCAGTMVAALDEAGGKALREAGCDFAICTLDGTSTAAFDPETMGQVVVATAGISDTTLRALAPLGLDALFVEQSAGPTTLADQLELVRMASFASLPLAVPVAPGTSVGSLRVLRDSGAAVAIAPAGTTADQVKALVEALKAVPAPKKGKSGGDMALVPSMKAHTHEDDDVEDPE